MSVLRKRPLRAAQDIDRAYRTDAPTGADRFPDVGWALDPAVLERNCVLPQVADRSALRAYKILRTRLLQRLAVKRWRTLAVTSAKAGEGKTLTAINLAMALSQEPNTQVCLVDLDLQRPQVASQMGLQAGPGARRVSARRSGSAAGDVRLRITQPGRDSEHPHIRSLFGDAGAARGCSIC